MKRKDLQELHAKTRDELLKLVMILEKDIRKQKMDAAEGKIKNVNEIRTKMKNCARMLTLIGEKTRQEGVIKEVTVKA